jgi:hypothetical protein
MLFALAAAEQARVMWGLLMPSWQCKLPHNLRLLAHNELLWHLLGQCMILSDRTMLMSAVVWLPGLMKPSSQQVVTALAQFRLLSK